ncbi:MAG: DUF1700 domain-containing protein [Lachnospiraceae bacterium]|nr:DUF1700 domain-containing protein [Lachnospiraceae bacterium]
MKKQEFLEELKQYLHVLEDEEQDDILQEYEQHIEMKIEKGLSEDEAIRDFGSVRELAGEILEAYHVKLDSKDNVKKNTDKKGLKKYALLSLKLLTLACSLIKLQLIKIGKGLRQGVITLCFFMGKPFRVLRKAMNDGQKKRKNGEWSIRSKVVAAGRNNENPIEKTEKKQERKGMILSMLAGGIKGLCYGILTTAAWIGRIIWNSGVVCATVFFALLGLIFLYLFGMLFILWQQGYPLGGVVLGCLGAVLCFISLAVFGSTFYRNKKSVLMHEKENYEVIRAE